MQGVELYAQVRYAVQIDGISRREAARRFGIDARTVAKMLAFSVPLGYRRSRPPARPKLDPFTGLIDAILAADAGRPKKQRHTALGVPSPRRLLPVPSWPVSFRVRVVLAHEFALLRAAEVPLSLEVVDV
jgi:hypothetical protein